MYFEFEENLNLIFHLSFHCLSLIPPSRIYAAMVTSFYLGGGEEEGRGEGSEEVSCFFLNS